MTPAQLRRMSRPALAVSIAAILASTVGVLVSSNAADDKKAEPPRPALTVTTAKPEQSRLPLSFAANGNVTRKKISRLFNPSVRAAASRSVFTPSNAARKLFVTSGNAWIDAAMIAAVTVNVSRMPSVR